MYHRIKSVYTKPVVLQQVCIRLEQSFLESVVENVPHVETAGQEVQTIDGSSSNFNHDWGND